MPPNQIQGLSPTKLQGLSPIRKTKKSQGLSPWIQGLSLKKI